jgi:phosphopantetheine adenylyltransferase
MQRINGQKEAIKEFIPQNEQQLKNKIMSLLKVAAIPRMNGFFTAAYGETNSIKNLVKDINSDDDLKTILRGKGSDKDFDLEEAKSLLANEEIELIFGDGAIEINSSINEEGTILISPH